MMQIILKKFQLVIKVMTLSNENERKLIKQFDIHRKKFKDIPLYTVGAHNTKLELQKLRSTEGTVEDAMELIKHNFSKKFKKIKKYEKLLQM